MGMGGTDIHRGTKGDMVEGEDPGWRWGHATPHRLPTLPSEAIPTAVLVGPPIHPVPRWDYVCSAVHTPGPTDIS